MYNNIRVSTTKSGCSSRITRQKKAQNQQTSPDALLDSWSSLRVITQNLDTTHEPTLQFHPLCYDRVEFASTSTVDVNFTEFSSFLSPTTSGSGLSYFSASSSGLSEGFVVGNQNLNNLQPNNCEIFSSPTSALNTQTTTALDFSFGELQMEPTFSFDNTDFFS